MLVVLAVLVLAGAGIGIFFAVHRSPAAQPLVQPPPHTAPSQSQILPTQPPPTSPAPTSTTLAPGLIRVGTAQVAADPLAAQVALTFETYFGGIDDQNYAQAYSAYSPAYQANTPLSALQSAEATTSDTKVSISSITQNADGSLTVDVNFTSQQAASDGPGGNEPCTLWALAYHLVPSTGGSQLGYVIDSAANIPPSPLACL